MKLTRRDWLKISGAASVAAVAPVPALAASHIVEMLNRQPGGKDRMVFHPAVIKIAPGDKVLFKSTDRGHNSESNKDMLPTGAKKWRGKIGQDIEVTFEQPGVYGYHCTPHRGVGMVGLVLVGDLTKSQLDAAAAVRQRGKASDRFKAYFKEAETLI